MQGLPTWIPSIFASKYANSIKHTGPYLIALVGCIWIPNVVEVTAPHEKVYAGFVIGFLADHAHQFLKHTVFGHLLGNGDGDEGLIKNGKARKVAEKIRKTIT